MNKESIKEVIFKRTSNVFLNTGIVALYGYLEKYYKEFELDAPQLTANCLSVRGDRCLEALEEIYYRMGREVYDTSIEEGNVKYFFTKKPFSATEFKTQNSYGLSGLITKPPLGPQPVPKKDENAEYFKDILENDPDFAMNLARFYLEKGLSLKGFDLVAEFNEIKINPNQNQKTGDSRIFLNEEYTKTPELPFGKEYLLPGKMVCPISGEKYKKLVKVQSTSAFFKNISNFNSFNTLDTKPTIGWKSAFLSRFSPKFCLYKYVKGVESSFDTIYCYLFETDNLLNLLDIIQQNRTMFMDDYQKRDSNVNYRTNFKVYSFSSKKGDQERLGYSKDLTEPSETLFMLIYTIYKNILFSRSHESSKDLEGDFFEAIFGSNWIPLSLIAFKADKFSGTLRPNNFEIFNQFKFSIRLIAQLEKNGLNFEQILRSLLFKERSDRNSKNSYRLERQIRNKVLDKMMKQKSILPDLENLFFKCFLYLNSTDADDIREGISKNYKSLFNLVNYYEPIILRNMEKDQIKSLQERAVNLGYSIGNAIVNFDDGSPQQNAKQSRKYIIDLHKSRTSGDFREALIRIQKKYGNVVSNDLLYAEELNDDQQFVFIKQFAVLAALNRLNSIFKPSSQNTSGNDN